MRRIGLLVPLVLCAFESAEAQTYRCKVDGKVVYQQAPCEGGDKVNVSGAGRSNPEALANKQLQPAPTKPENRGVDEQPVPALSGIRDDQGEIDRAVRSGRIKVGMKAEHVIRAWGRPDKINRTVTARGSYEQWVYRRGSIAESQYVYVDNGIVRSIQSSE